MSGLHSPTRFQDVTSLWSYGKCLISSQLSFIIFLLSLFHWKAWARRVYSLENISLGIVLPNRLKLARAIDCFVILSIFGYSYDYVLIFLNVTSMVLGRLAVQINHWGFVDISLSSMSKYKQTHFVDDFSRRTFLKNSYFVFSESPICNKPPIFQLMA